MPTEGRLCEEGHLPAKEKALEQAQLQNCEEMSFCCYAAQSEALCYGALANPGEFTF